MFNIYILTGLMTWGSYRWRYKYQKKVLAMFYRETTNDKETGKVLILP